MSWSRRVTELFARITDMVRRFVPTSTADPTRWEVEGFVDGDETERDELDVFQGIGFASRPPDGAAAECVAVAVNARDHHVVVATREAATLQAVVEKVGLVADETIVFTSQAVIKILADGTVEIRAVDGTAAPLAFKSELDALNDRIDSLEATYNQHTHPDPVSGFTSAPVESSETSATINGTTVFKGQ